LLHESDLENNIKITDTDINFEIIYNKNYIPQQYINEIKKANVLIIPSEGFRDDNDICYFPECTSEFYGFLKNKKKIQTEICIDDDHFQTLELHADIIYIATLMVQYVVLPIVINLISAYLVDKVKSMNEDSKSINVNIHIIVEKNGKSKKIDYNGSVANLEKTMKVVEKTIFK